MDLYLVQYLSKSKVINEESIHSVIIYLNMITTHITNFYESQSVRNTMLNNLTSPDEDHRNNKARLNYRLMKKWKENIKLFRGQLKSIEEVLKRAELLAAEDDASISTLVLKEHDCLMRHCIKRKRKKV